MPCPHALPEGPVHLTPYQGYNFASEPWVIRPDHWTKLHSEVTRYGRFRCGHAFREGIEQEGIEQTPGVVPRHKGWDIESRALLTSQCSQNRDIPGQGAKAFWDYDDNNNETGFGATWMWHDTHDVETTWLARQWDEFSDGTGNRDDYESGQDGVNLWDFMHYACNGCTSSIETVLEHNCMQAQTTF